MHRTFLRDGALIIELDELRIEIGIKRTDILRKGVRSFRLRSDASDRCCTLCGLNKGLQKRMPCRMSPHNAPFRHTKTVRFVTQSGEERGARLGNWSHEKNPENNGNIKCSPRLESAAHDAKLPCLFAQTKITSLTVNR